MKIKVKIMARTGFGDGETVPFFRFLVFHCNQEKKSFSWTTECYDLFDFQPKFHFLEPSINSLFSLEMFYSTAVVVLSFLQPRMFKAIRKLAPEYLHQLFTPAAQNTF